MNKVIQPFLKKWYRRVRINLTFQTNHTYSFSYIQNYIKHLAMAWDGPFLTNGRVLIVNNE